MRKVLINDEGLTIGKRHGISAHISTANGHDGQPADHWRAGRIMASWLGKHGSLDGERAIVNGMAPDLTRIAPASKPVRLWTLMITPPVATQGYGGDHREGLGGFIPR